VAKSNEIGYFLLDAVDEACLNGLPALQAALRAIRDVLRPYLQRVSFFVSSRVTDWSVRVVRETVEQTLLKPICDAEASNVAAVAADTDTLEVKGNKNASSIQLEVYCLDPLSKPDAKRLAEAHGARPVEAFWQEVEEGGYEFMAGRPLDVEWMAKQWVASKKLGTYSELIETAVTHRLRETNQSYIDSGAVLSPAQLRAGAEQIAAACTFSGRPYVLVTAGESMDSAISPADALPDWTPLEHRRLLGTAIFDEETYGRVRFHHRAVREYVDDDKRTDIEVSSAAGKVCIEIKPVDSHRSYSANSLTQTLGEQLVGQYLRGQNSKHGVLVIFRLDDKKWEIPGGPERGDFNELIGYLAEQAAKIEANSTAVESLRVIGINCVPAKPPMP
jgi:hypothetical protein